MLKPARQGADGPTFEVKELPIRPASAKPSQREPNVESAGVPPSSADREGHKLVIREQPRLPLSTQVEICADGIHHRLFRSLTTLVVVTLAVAFLMNMLAENVVVGALKHGVARELYLPGQFEQLTALVRLRDTEREFQQRLAGLPAGDLQAGVLARWTGLAPAAFDEFRRQAESVERMQNWFDALSVSHRRLLFETGRVEDPLSLLTQLGQWKRFADRAAQIPTLDVPRELAGVVEHYARYRPLLQERREQVAARAARLNAHLGERRLEDRLAAAAGDPAELAGVTALLDEHDVPVEPGMMGPLSEQAVRHVQLRAMQQTLTALQSHQQWQEVVQQGMTQDDALKALAAQGQVGRWLQARLAERLEGVIAADQLVELAKHFNHNFRAEDLRVKLTVEYGAELGMGTKMFWLVVVSMVVCVVGITNAMLVSVLERFREIATMKCLGAMDGLIATLFLLEAAFLGMVGGLAGVVIGGLIGLGRMAVYHGGWVGKFFPAGGLLRMAGLSILTGLLLTTLAAIYPAFKAAKMLPMEAMRVE